jgi:hypothetical protein
LAVAAMMLTPAHTAPARVPIVVELFTSEGCSSCPPADSLLQSLVATQPLEGAQIIALGEHVDYWDQLGWKDRFSSAALTNRQRMYGASLNDESVYTPQMIVDGRSAFVGSDASAAKRAIERAVSQPHGTVDVTTEAGATTVAVSAAVFFAKGAADRADMIVAVTEDHLRSNVTRGENHGRTLAHASVVRYLAKAGEAAAGDRATIHKDVPIGSDWQRDQLKVVAFVQERRGRAILASAETPVVRR